MSEKRRFLAREEMVEESLLQWQAEPEEEKHTKGLDKMIKKAHREGWGFKLTVFAEVLENSGPSSVAITEEHAAKYAEVNEDLITITIPPKDTEVEVKNKGSHVFATILRDEPTLVFVSKEEGAVGYFRPHEIDSLELE